MKTHIKICGIKEPEALQAATGNGARFVGFVFFPPSPRHITIDIAQELAYQVPTGVRSVGLFVDPTDEELEAVLGKVQLDMIQLHGHEDVARVAAIKDQYMMPIIKAFPVAEAADLEGVEEYADLADWFLFDAKPPKDAAVPGGTGKSFDWGILEGRMFSKPWMLSGGLTPDNVAEACTRLSPDAVDVSSGVEARRGEKDPQRIKAFLEAVNGL